MSAATLPAPSGTRWLPHPNGGGMVADTATVDPSAYIGPTARVSGTAQVSENAHVSGNAQVSGDAWVFGAAQVYGDAQVSGDARVFWNARVLGDARISSGADILCFSGVGRDFATLTAHKDSECVVRVTRGCFSGTLEEFLAAVWKTHGRRKAGQEYRAIAEVIKIRFRKELNKHNG